MIMLVIHSNMEFFLVLDLIHTSKITQIMANE